MFKARKSIKSPIKMYSPGDNLGEEFSVDEIARLKKLKAIEGDYTENEVEDEAEEAVFWNETQLKKFSSKQKLVDYAATIGLELSEAARKEDIVSSILNYIAELQESNKEKVEL